MQHTIRFGNYMFSLHTYQKNNLEMLARYWTGVGSSVTLILQFKIKFYKGKLIGNKGR